MTPSLLIQVDVSSIPDNMFPPGLVFESSPFSLVMSQEWLLEAAHYSNITPTTTTNTYVRVAAAAEGWPRALPDTGAAVLPPVVSHHT